MTGSRPTPPASKLMRGGITRTALKCVPFKSANGRVCDLRGEPPAEEIQEAPWNSERLALAFVCWLACQKGLVWFLLEI